MPAAEAAWKELAGRLGVPGGDALSVAMALDRARLSDLDEVDSMVLGVALQRKLADILNRLPGVAGLVLDRARLGDESRARVRGASESLAVLRDRLADATAGQQAATAEAQETAELEHRIADLRQSMERLRVLTQALPELREAAARLEAGLLPEHREAALWEERVGKAVMEAGRLLSAKRQTLAPELRATLLEAEQLARALDADQRQLENALSRYSTLLRDTREVREALGLYHEADRAVTAALPPDCTGEASRLLDECQRLLQAADNALQIALEAHERAGRVTVLKPGGTPA